MTDGAVNMLEQMASGIVEEKAVKGRGLTPLVSEGRPMSAPDSLPNDLGLFMSNETLAEHEAQLRKFAADAIAIADGIAARLTGTYLAVGPGGPVVDEAAAQREKERAADERVAALQSPPAEPVDLVAELQEIVAAEEPTEQETFDANLAAQTAAAQAATFMPSTDGTAVTPPGTGEPHANTVSGGGAPSGWACPNGHDTVEEKVSPRGRQFARCTTCGAFQK